MSCIGFPAINGISKYLKVYSYLFSLEAERKIMMNNGNVPSLYP